MKLKAQVGSLDEVPEGLRELYVETEGGFALQVEGAIPETEVAGLKKKAAELLAEKKKIEAKLAEVDLDEYQRLKAAAEELETKAATSKGQYEQLLAKAQEKFEKELTRTQEREKALRGWIERTLVESELTKAIAAAKGVPELLLPVMRERVRVVEDEDGFRLEVLDRDRKAPMLGAKLEPATPADLVGEFQRNETFGRAFESPIGPGGGARNGGPAPRGVANPFRRESENLTEQMRLLKESPALAKQLQAEAQASAN